MKVVLASGSPRRKELLEQMGVEFEVVVSQVDEVIDRKLNYHKIAESLSEQKALNVFSSLNGDRLVIGSDTMVVYKNEIFGKPKDENQAIEMLMKLSGKTHHVVTGLCVIVSRNNVTTKYLFNETTKVKFKKIDKNDIEKYVATREPMDKAGAYAIQGISGKFIDSIKGNYASVVGLPTNLLFDILKKENIL